MSGAPILRIRGLVKSYADPDGGRVRVVDLPSLDVASGTQMAIAGESGTGKTTLLHLIAGITPADDGVIEVGGERMTGRSERVRDRLRAKHIGILFQTFNLLPTLTALENVALGMTFRPKVEGKPRALALEALQRVGLANRVNYRPSQLSVGQQQRVAIARSLVGRPALLLADEPTSNLDARRAEEGLDLIQGFARDAGAALLLVSHDPRALERFELRMDLEAPERAPADGASA